MAKTKAQPDAAFIERLRIVAEQAGGLRALARKTKISPTAMNSYVNRGVDPSRTALIKIFLATGSSLNWLVLGLGDQIPHQGYDDREEDDRPYRLLWECRPDPSNGRLEDVLRRPWPKAWLAERGLDTKEAKTCMVSDDSMEPVLCRGDTLFLDVRNREFAADAIYLVLYGGSYRFKRLIRLVDGGIRITSDNPRYGSEELEWKSFVEQVKVVARVHARVALT